VLRLYPLIFAGLAVGSGAAKIKHRHPILQASAPFAAVEEPVREPDPEPPPAPPAPPSRVFGGVPATPALPQVAQVSGRVFDGDQPLADTTLELDAGRHVVVVTTDVDGRFDTSIAPGVYTITLDGERLWNFNALSGRTIQLEPIHPPVREAVVDVEDRCPDQPENVNGFEDNDGCPDREMVERSRENLANTIIY
jgi:hypothetical protein